MSKNVVPLEVSKQLYNRLALLRFSEEAIIKHYPEDDMKTPMHMSMGQEAAPTGICMALGDRAQVISSYRSHAPFLARTGNVDKFFAEMYGRSTGTADGKAGSMHLSDPEAGHLFATGIVGAGIAPALGAAYANKFLERPQIVATFFGDGAVDEGVFWESLNVASLMRLPVFFVCEDNGYGVHTSREMRHGFSSIGDIVKNFDCPFIFDDSNDVEVIYSHAIDGLRHIEENGGPFFFQIKCHRYLEHVGIGLDFDKKYRSQNEVEKWQRDKDCLMLQRECLIKKNVSSDVILKFDQDIRTQVETAIIKAQRATPPGSESLYKGVFYEKD
jgi:TPP-dependent pyruvate/acetoin dehydrogenase alpha subunit